jgi:hypothetical protein
VSIVKNAEDQVHKTVIVKNVEDQVHKTVIVKNAEDQVYKTVIVKNAEDQVHKTVIVKNAEDQVHKTVTAPVPLHGCNTLTFALRRELRIANSQKRTEPKAKMSNTGYNTVRSSVACWPTGHSAL